MNNENENNYDPVEYALNKYSYEQWAKEQAEEKKEETIKVEFTAKEVLQIASSLLNQFDLQLFVDRHVSNLPIEHIAFLRGVETKDISKKLTIIMRKVRKACNKEKEKRLKELKWQKLKELAKGDLK